MSRLRTLVMVLAATQTAMVARAGTFTLSGSLNDPTNTALVGSDLGAPLFDNDNDIANNVALYTFSLTTAGTVNFLSEGFALGGIDPYFTLFSGTGNAGTFVDSNYFQAFTTGGDFDLDEALGVGDYTVAMGVFANMSFAENSGSGTLGDGFIGLGEPGSLGDYSYKLQITSAVPEPSYTALVALGVMALLVRLRRVHTQSS